LNVTDLSKDILDEFSVNDQGNPFLLGNTPKASNGDPLIVLTAEDCTDEAGESALCGACDELLQSFHRVDEGLGIAGKWAGGSVTGVCRGWGTSKVRTKLLLNIILGCPV